MPHLPLDLLRIGAQELGIELNDGQLEKFERYAEILVETNRKLNLTRITDPRDIVTHHYLDSLTCLAAANVPGGSKCIDIGTGAGFPGIPIAIARPDLDLTLMDSVKKKLDFIKRAAENIGLDNVQLVNLRAEDAGRDARYREQYDIAWARAVSEMKVLVELCLPLVRVGGHFVAQKSSDVDEEICSARPIIGQLGAKVERDLRIQVSGTDIVRRLIVLAKKQSTPGMFPRSFSRITKGA